MEPEHVAIGFYKNQRRFIAIDNVGRLCVTDDASSALRMTRTQAALAAALAGVRFNLASCRAVSVDDMYHAEPI